MAGKRRQYNYGSFILKQKIQIGGVVEWLVRTAKKKVKEQFKGLKQIYE